MNWCGNKKVRTLKKIDEEEGKRTQEIYNGLDNKRPTSTSQYTISYYTNLQQDYNKSFHKLTQNLVFARLTLNLYKSFSKTHSKT